MCIRTLLPGMRADGFGRITWVALLVVALLALVAVAVDYAAAALGAKRFGGTWWGVGGAVAGLIVGMFFGFVGIVVGPLVGAVALELVGARRKTEEALKAGFGTFVGFVLGTMVRYALVVTMLGVAVGAYFFS